MRPLVVFSKEDVDHLMKMLKRLDVQFVFVQAKTSAKFEGNEIGTKMVVSWISELRFKRNNITKPALSDYAMRFDELWPVENRR